MPIAALIAGLLTILPTTRPALPVIAEQMLDRPGVFAATPAGLVELPVFGEQRKVEGAIDTFLYAPADLERIPMVHSARAFYVNLMGWQPKDLYLVAGGKGLASPRDNYRRLNGVAYAKGPILFEVVTDKLEPSALEDEHRRLTRKKRPGDDMRAFVVIELASQAGLNRRAYPVQVDIAPAASDRR